MFRFLVKFLKIMVIACIIGVLLRVIDIMFLKQKPNNITTSNIVNEIRDEKKTEIASNTTNTEEQKDEEKIETESAKKQEIAKEKQEENKKSETKQEIKQEEKQNVSTNKPLPKTAEQEVTETKKQTQKETQTEESYTEIVIDMAEKKECSDNNHGRDVGNCGKWFKTKEDAIATYKAEIKKWGDKWSNNEISDEDYYSNCPYGYEIWDCPFCSKWTINYYFDI